MKGRERWSALCCSFLFLRMKGTDLIGSETSVGKFYDVTRDTWRHDASCAPKAVTAVYMCSHPCMEQRDTRLRFMSATQRHLYTHAARKTVTVIGILQSKGVSTAPACCQVELYLETDLSTAAFAQLKPESPRGQRKKETNTRYHNDICSPY